MIGGETSNIEVDEVTNRRATTMMTTMMTKGENQPEQKEEAKSVRDVGVQGPWQYSFWRKTPRFARMTSKMEGAWHYEVRQIQAQRAVEREEMKDMKVQSRTTYLEKKGKGSIRFMPLPDKSRGAWSGDWWKNRRPKFSTARGSDG